LPPTTPSSSTVGGIPTTTSPTSGATNPPQTQSGIPGDHP
jgi:hypothetical protein